MAIIRMSAEYIEQLRLLGVKAEFNPNIICLPSNVIFEPPCSIKKLNIEYSIQLGAFSYGVSGYYFASKIGRYCSFGENVQIGRHSHPMHWISTSPFFYWKYEDILGIDLPEGIEINIQKDYFYDSPPVVLKTTSIGNDVWIGHGAFILPGVTVGDGAVIAAMSVVTKDVPPYSIVAGSPAKVIRYRFEQEQITELIKLKWWQFAPWQLKGTNLDNIDVFISQLNKLIADNILPYQPRKVGFFDGNFLFGNEMAHKKQEFFDSSEYRKLVPLDFDLPEYFLRNEDVLFVDSDPYQHYISYGKKENRAYKR